MSTTIQSCPGCKSLILSDTYECPECGCVLDQQKKDAANAQIASDLKNANLTEECPHCREQVRIGLVRCWKCGGFMRDDIARQYENMTSSPQQIIYSDVPPEERTDFMPARDGADPQSFHANVFDADDDTDDDFSLDDETQLSSDAAGRDFELDSAPGTVSRTAAPEPVSELAATPAPVTDSPDKPDSQTPGAKNDGAQGDAKEAEKSDGKESNEGEDAAQPPAAGADELLSIAIQEQREVRKRRQAAKAEQRAKRMLIPCRCGAWVRVHERQAGRTVRCRQCKRSITIPDIKRKAEKKTSAAAEVTQKVQLDWLEEVWLHTLDPTALVLKPGSLADDYSLADVAFSQDGLTIVRPEEESKKKGWSLFGGGRSQETDLRPWREAVRKHFENGKPEDVPNAAVAHIAQDRVSELKIVQPIAKVQESMFAGIPIFGEGRIAIFLPLDLDEGRQAFCSLSLSKYRELERQMKKAFGIELPGDENGVPAELKHETLSCHYSQSKVEAVKDLPYYQQDPGYELTLTGYRCANCGIAVSEESRAKNKLGGANGKSIAKAKCPKCSGKFGDQPLYKAVQKSSPAAEETEDPTAEK